MTLIAAVLLALTVAPASIAAAGIGGGCYPNSAGDYKCDPTMYFSNSSYTTTVYPNRQAFTVYVTLGDGSYGGVNGVLSVREGSRLLYSRALATDESPTITLPVLAAGRHTLTVSYSGDAFYYAGSTFYVFDILRGASALHVAATSTSPLSARLAVSTQSQTGVVTAVYSGHVVARGSLSGGRANLLIPKGLKDGRQNITVRFAGTANYAATSRTVALAVRGYSPTIRVTANSVVYPKRATLMTNVSGAKGAAGGTLSISHIHGKLALSGGKRSALLPKLSPGTYRITIAYNGESTSYSARSVTTTVKIVRGK